VERITPDDPLKTKVRKQTGHQQSEEHLSKVTSTHGHKFTSPLIHATK